jgi:hypothetical protein
MDAAIDPTELTVKRRVFAAWSIEIPSSFADTVVREDGFGMPTKLTAPCR